MQPFSVQSNIIDRVRHPINDFLLTTKVSTTCDPNRHRATLTRLAKIGKTQCTNSLVLHTNNAHSTNSLVLQQQNGRRCRLSDK